MKTKREKFDVNASDRPVWISKALWGWEDDPVKSYKRTPSVIEADYRRWCNGDLSLSNPLYSRFTDLHYDDDMRATFVRLLNGNGGVIVPNGDYNGIGVSFESAADAKHLSKKATEIYVSRKKEEDDGVLAKNKKHAIKLNKITNGDLVLHYHFKQDYPYRGLEEVDLVLHYHFKQDYPYRGLEEVFTGEVKLADLIKIEQARCDEDYDLVISLIRETFGEGLIEMSVDEFFDANNNRVVKKLSKGKSVSGCDEIGYEAIATTANKARKQVQKLYLEYADI
jgi:hypothetical protein